jgi:hypothetical protein
MKNGTEAIKDHVAKCAKMDMSQREIADLLRVAPSTIHTITSQLGIKLKRKKRVNEPNSNYYKQVRAGQFDHVERAEDIDEVQSEAAFGGTERADREAAVSVSRSAEGRLKAKLVGVTSKHQRYEITYGHCLLEFEKLQHKLGKREPLPSNQKKSSSMHKGAIEIAELRKKNAVEQGQRLLPMLADDRVITTAEAAELLGDTTPRTADYLVKLVEAGHIYQARDFVFIPRYTSRQWRWVFSKQPIVTKYKFEDD